MSPDKVIETIERIAPPDKIDQIKRHLLMRFFWYMGCQWVAKLTNANSHTTAFYYRHLNTNPKFKPYIEQICFALGEEPQDD